MRHCADNVERARSLLRLQNQAFFLVLAVFLLGIVPSLVSAPLPPNAVLVEEDVVHGFKVYVVDNPDKPATAPPSWKVVFIKWPDGKTLQITEKNGVIAHNLIRMRKGEIGPQEFYRAMGAAGIARDDLIRFKTTSGNCGPGTMQTFFGKLYEAGGSEIEAKLLKYRDDITLKNAKQALVNAAAKGLVKPDSKVYFGYVGSCEGKPQDALTLEGDIDVSLMSNDTALQDFWKDEYERLMRADTHMPTDDIDSVATKHGRGMPGVYVGPWGKDYGDQQFAKPGVTLLEVRPDGSFHPVSGKDALTELAAERDILGRKIGDVEAGKYRVGHTEPGLSMEMIRHLTVDIIDAGVYDSLSELVKASKYLKRANDSVASLGIKPSDADQAAFAQDMDDLNKGRNSGGKRDVQGLLNRIRSYPEFQGKLPVDVVAVKGRVEGSVEGKLELNQLAKKFLNDCVASMWTVSKEAFKSRVDGLQAKVDKARQNPDLNTRTAELNDIRNEMTSLRDMIDSETKLFKDKGVDIPADVDIIRQDFVKLEVDFTAEFKVRPITDSELKTLEFLRELCKNKEGGVKMAAAQFIQLVDKTVGTANSFLDIVDDALLEELRGEECTNRFLKFARGKIRDSATAKRLGLDTDVLAGVKATSAVQSIQTINDKLNTMIQNSSSGFAVSKGLQYYNLYGEMAAYRAGWINEGWRGVATEIFRRRIPGGGAAEAVVMGNYTRATWECITTVFPVLAIPEAVAGITIAAMDYGVDFYWSEQLGVFKDGLFDSAVFKVDEAVGVHTIGGVKTTQWKLVSVKYEGRTYQKDEIRTVLIGDNWDVKDTLRQTILSGDPVLNELWKIISRADMTQKLSQYKFWPQYHARRETLYDQFAQKLIMELEKRMGAEFADTAGTFPELAAALKTLSEELEIAEPMQKAMDNEDYGSSRWAVTAYIWNLKRDRFCQGNVQTTFEKYVEIVLKYLNTYSAAKAAREAIEKQLELTSATRKDTGLRLYTGAFLTGNADDDAATLVEWQKLPGQLGGILSDQMLQIKREALKDPGALLDTDYDQDTYISGLRMWVWRKAWINVYKAQTLDEFRTKGKTLAEYHKEQLAELLKAYKKHYEGQWTTVELTVTCTVGGEETKVTNGTVAVTPLEKQSLVVRELKANAKGIYAAALMPGKYELAISATGFRAPNGDDILNHDITVPAPADAGNGRAATLPITLELEAVPGQLVVQVRDAKTKAGIEGASVTLLPKVDQHPGPLTADASGRVTLDKLPPNDDYRIDVQADCYDGPISKTGIVVDNVQPERSTAELTVDMNALLSEVAVTVQDEDGAAIPQAQVSVGSDHAGETAANGTAEFAGVRPSFDQPYVLKVSAPGYAPVEDDTFEVRPTPGKQRVIKTVTLVRGGMVRARVVDDSGAGVAGAEVILSWGANNSKRAFSGEDGRVVFEKLAVAEYWLTASKENYTSPKNDVQALVTAANPEPGEVTVRLREGIMVKVFALDGKDPVAGANIALDGTAGNGLGGTSTFLVKPGKHRITVSAKGYHDEDVEKEIGPGTQTVMIPLSPAITLTIVTKDNDTQGLAQGTTVTLSGGVFADPVSKGGPQAVFPGIKQGSYSVKVTGDGYSDHASQLSLAGIKRNEDVVIWLAQKKSSISVGVALTVPEGSEPPEKQPEVTITLSGKGGGKTAEGTAATFANLAAGDYSVSASAKGYKGDSATVSLKPPAAGQAQLTLVMIPVDKPKTEKKDDKKENDEEDEDKEEKDTEEEPGADEPPTVAGTVPGDDNKPTDKPEDSNFVDVDQLEGMSEDELVNDVNSTMEEIEEDDGDLPAVTDLTKKTSGGTGGSDDTGTALPAEIAEELKEVAEELDTVREDEKQEIREELKDILFAEGDFDLSNYINKYESQLKANMPDEITSLDFQSGESKIALKINRKTGEVTGKGRISLNCKAVIERVLRVPYTILNRPNLQGKLHDGAIDGTYRDSMGRFELKLSFMGQVIEEFATDMDTMTGTWDGGLRSSQIDGEYGLNFGGTLKNVMISYHAEVMQGFDSSSGGQADREIAAVISAADAADPGLGSSAFSGWSGGDRNTFEVTQDGDTLVVTGRYYQDELARFSAPITLRTVSNVSEFRFAQGSIENLSSAGYVLYATTSGALHYMLLGLDSTPSYGSAKAHAQPAVTMSNFITSDYAPGSMALSGGSRAAEIEWRTKQGTPRTGFIKKYGGFATEW